MNLSEIGLDVSFQKDDIYRRSRRLICFDMDSTLIETEVIDELAERAGVGDAVREITAQRHAGRDRLPRKLSPSAWRCSRGWTSRSWRRSPVACRSPRGWSA